MEEMKTAKLRRANIKRQLTLFVTFINDIDQSRINETINLQIKTRLEKIEPLWQEFDNIQSTIEILDGGQTDDNVRESFETSYFDIVPTAKHLIQPKFTQSAPLPNDHQNVGNVKLPTINLPNFDGSYEHWLEFHDAFNALIHENVTVKPIQKLYYLQSCLKGDAAKILQSLEVSESNYNIAWEMLRERFKNTRLIVNNHVKALFNLNSMNKESHSSLRQILDTVVRHLRCLKTLKQPVDHWDTLVIHIVSTKLDNVTRRDWESVKIEGELPTWVEMANFLKNKCELLETLEYSKVENKRVDIKFKREPIITNSYLTTYKPTCVFCNKDHSIYKCESFTKLPVNSRLDEVKRLNLCIICLRNNHFAKDCRSSRCRKCSRGHNTLLHFENKLVERNNIDREFPSTSHSNVITHSSNNTPQVEGLAIPQVSISNHSLNYDTSQILLSTASILVEDIHGNKHNCRVLLDSGSQSNFITKDLCERLGLDKTTVNFSVKGINQTAASVTQKSEVRIYSRYNDYNVMLSYLVLPKITENLPIISFDCSKLNIPRNIRLADSDFNITGNIDMLLGAGIFYELLCVGQVRLGKGLPVLHKTQFGWVISGNMNHANAATNVVVSSYCSIEHNNSIDNQLQRFWQLEECNNQYNTCTREEQECEKHFIQTTKHASDGRFVVSIPLKQNFDKLGNSRNSALKRFYALERKLDKDINLKREYQNFMQEYENLNHMSKIKESLSNGELAYYLPHHAVIKEASLTTKVRVVFDGSAKTDTGLSLNDVQMVGPTIQNDLLSIILRFRKHAYVVTADIAKMYRQILVNNADRKFQRIFWRSDNSQELECFELNTVTYGTASAPFLAIRCLQQLAIENESKYPKASKVIQNDFYVDDLLTGADSRGEVIKLQTDINTILRSAGFNLRKWLSNDHSILQEFQGSQLEDNILNMCDNQETKTLGILWNARLDTFQYSISKIPQRPPVTKRTILANTAQIFDPLGLLGPIIINAKLLIQKLWQHKLSWDESIPIDLHTQWLNFRGQLDTLNKVKIPRHVVGKDPIILELHGFSDSSERAYGACIYIRSIDKWGKCIVNLVCAKSKVAPLRSVTLPRLELCGAILLARLAETIVKVMSVNFSDIFYWCDSTIVLHWIRAEPKRWTTFVANRVSEIQNITKLDQWRHVRSSDNPADLISRGVSPPHLIESNLWWHGPSWLSSTENHWTTEQTIIESIDVPETRNTTINLPTAIIDFGLFTKYSSVSKLERVFAYCRRFQHNSLTLIPNRRFGQLTVEELQQARLKLIKIAQNQAFENEIRNLIANNSVHTKSRILSLNPFLDSNGVLRVGGRLEQSNFEFDKKHPIILPSSHPLTKLIVTDEHVRLLHCGPQALLASLRERYWPIYGRNLVKKVVHDCVICFKNKPKGNPYIMGGLPETRLAPTTPFHITGVDYAGPFLIRDRKTRNYKLTKSYVCLFICFATKAVHLELVCDLTTDAFLASFRRFVSRRGKPQKVYSDNGTNFIGANAELKSLSKFLANEVNKNHIIDSLVKDNISWYFIPPKSPHFGGLWEAGIKSTKTHLNKVIGNAYLTFEDMYTVLTQIEAVLNSRPLCPMSTEPDDLTPITPAHFLIGRTLTSLPNPDLTQIVENRLSRYQRLQQLTQHFWKRWSSEYISSLQTRIKWKHPSSNTIKVGSLVVLREENLPPLKWKLGRVSDLHPGPDGVIRVVSVKVANGVFKRSVTKICVLPID